MVCITVFLGLLLPLDWKQYKMQEDMLLSNSQCSVISDSIASMSLLASSFLRTGSFENLPEYTNLIQQLKNQIQDKVTNTKDSTVYNYLRRIDAFNEYQASLLDHLNITSKYDSLTFLKTTLDMQQNQVQKLVVENQRQEIILYNILNAKIKRARMYLWVFALVVLLVFFILFRKITNKIFSTLHTVQFEANELASQHWDTPNVALVGYRELDDLSSSLNSMKQELISYLQMVEQNAKMEKELAQRRLDSEKKDLLLLQAQMAALRAQINPHFLFNALNIISKSIFLNNAELSMELVEAISTILRYSLDATDRLVHFKEELQIVEAYLFLQKSRFGNAVTVEISIMPQCKDLLMPPMIIQPMVENCFKHGFGAKPHLNILIEAKILEGDLFIEVKDNGVGIDPSNVFSEHCVGISNVSKRLQLRYKRQDVFTLHGEKGRYTSVKLKIPQEKVQK
jgi:sensor histidine kinase YesM